MEAEFPLSSEPITVYVHNEQVFTFDEHGNKVLAREYRPDLPMSWIDCIQLHKELTLPPE